MIVTATIVARVCATIADRLRADRRNATSEATANNRALLPAVHGDPALGADAHIAHRERIPSHASLPPPQRSEPSDSKRPFSEPAADALFQIQFLGGETGEGPDVVEEAEVCAPNVFEAYRVAEHHPWPPDASGLRILDSRGQTIFWRRKPGTDNGFEFHLHLTSKNAPADRSARLVDQTPIAARSGPLSRS